ncbi:MAG: anti-sigma factor antagonist [Clostridia bacterium]|nr:anti-sigma factor antagonist [Clostridia bacterium]
MEVTAYRCNGALNVELCGELDHHAAACARRELDAAIAADTNCDVILNMSRVTFMDSSGLGVLLGRYKRVAANGGKMYIYGASRTVDKLLRMSGIYSLIERIG